MANKNLDIIVNVDSSKLDATTKKLGELKDFGKGLKIQYDIDGKPLDVVLDKSLNLQKQVRVLTAELRRTKEGTAEFTLLSNRLNDTKDDLDRVNAKSREFFGTLSLIPGPIGQISAKLDGTISALEIFSKFSFKDISGQFKKMIGDVGGIISSIGKATGITKLYGVANEFLAGTFIKIGVAEGVATVAARAFSAALIATGVGALVVGLGYLIGKLTELGGELDTVTPKVTRLATEFNKLREDAKLNEAEELAYLKSVGTGEERLYQTKRKYKEQEIVDARNAFKQFQGQMTAEQIMNGTNTEAYKNALKERQNAEKVLKQAKSDLRVLEYQEDERLYKKTVEANKTANDKRIADNKAASDKIIADTKTFNQKKLAAQNEFEILSESSEYKQRAKKIVQDAKAEEQEIQALKLKATKINGIVVSAEEQKQQLITQVYKNAQINLDKLYTEYQTKENDRFAERLNANIELSNKIINIQIQMIKDEKTRRQEELKQKAEEDIESLENSKASEEKKAQAIAIIRKKLKFDLEQLDEDIKKKENDTLNERLDKELKFLEVRQQAITKGTLSFFDSQREILLKSQEKELAQLDLTEAQKTAIKEKYAKLRNDVDKEEFNTYLGFLNTGLSAAANAFSAQSNIYNQEQTNRLAEQEIAYKEEKQRIYNTISDKAQQQKAIVDLDKQAAIKQDKIKEEYFYKNRGAQYAQAMISAFQAAISAYSSLAVIPVVGPALGAAAAAVALGFGIKQANLIKQQKYVPSVEPSSGPTTMENFGKNYGDGGMIEGPRHSSKEGGVPIMAEGGEAIMTRGAVTMFKPLLSMMNQAGGGTSFNSNLTTTSYDQPKTAAPSDENKPMIVKSYVVSSELTNEQQKQARLKNLSTL
jgi:hypothetical protein